MSAPNVSPAILKAAMLFVSRKETRSFLMLPWAYRRYRDNVVWASDGHTMFVARDKEGSGFGKKPVHVGGKPIAEAKMPDWRRVVDPLVPVKRTVKSVAINPKYHARVMRAASLLDVGMVMMDVGRAHDAVSYTIGHDAFAAVMPMRAGYDWPPVPKWLQGLIR